MSKNVYIRTNLNFMKYFYLFAFIIVAQTINSQIITIPDANFKAKLLEADWTNQIAIDYDGNSIKIDTNNNGEIEVSEAWSVVTLDVSSSNISSLAGLEHFFYIDNFTCNSNLLTSFDFDNLTFIDLSLSGNQISSISIEASKSTINNLVLHDNNFTSFEFMPTSSNPNAVKLYMYNNDLTSMTLAGVFHIVHVQATLLTHLDLSNCHVVNVYVGGNSSLSSINIKNGHVNTENIIGLTVAGVDYICIDEGDLQGDFIPGGIPVNSYCSFTPGGQFYTLSGMSIFDGDINGCGPSDAASPNMKFNIANGSVSGTVISNTSGSYSIPVQAGTHTITPILENPTYFSVSPASVTVTFPEIPSPALQNFCITPNGTHHDVSIIAMPSGAAVPGFDAYYSIKITNTGNQLASGTVQFTYDEAVLDFISASGGDATGTSGQLSILYSNIQPFASQFITLTFNLNSPMETPALNQDDVLQFSATAINTATDESPANNTMAFPQTVVNSMDPNHKTCVEGPTIPPSMVGEYVHYKIDFENLGTFPATNVVVKDMIDTAKFDVATLVPVASSHSFITRITETNRVEFIFEGINLPFDDANNDGYIVFKIKTLPTLVLGNTFSNTASIYFDYNFPIITNTESTTITALSSPDFDFVNFFTMYPNPAGEMLNLLKTAEITVSSFSIYNMLGQQLIVIPNAANIDSVDISTLGAGTYFLKVITDRGSSAIKFIKQ